MKFSAVKNNVRVLNKLTGQENVILVGGEEGAKVASAFPVDEQGEIIDGSEPVVVTEQNAICFRLIEDPNPKEVPTGYTVVDGVLTKDGQQVEQGEIVVDKIIATQPGLLILAVKPREGEGFDLFSYMPEKDSFRKLIRTTISGETTIIPDKDGNILIVYADVEEKTLDGNADKPRTVKILNSSGIIYVKEGRVVGARIDGSVPSLNASEYIEVQGRSMVLIPNDAAIDYDEDADMDVLVDLDERRYIAFYLEDGTVRFEETHGTIESATFTPLGGKLYKGQGKALVNACLIKTPKLDQITGKYIIDVTVDGDETRYTFADEKYNTQTLIRRDTRDRGPVYSVA